MDTQELDTLAYKLADQCLGYISYDKKRNGEPFDGDETKYLTEKLLTVLDSDGYMANE